jgi:hypothetical protein
MTAPADAAVAGLTELAVRARTDAGQVNTVPPAPGRSLSQILRANVLTRRPRSIQRKNNAFSRYAAQNGVRV